MVLDIWLRFSWLDGLWGWQVTDGAKCFIQTRLWKTNLVPVIHCSSSVCGCGSSQKCFCGSRKLPLSWFHLTPFFRPQCTAVSAQIASVWWWVRGWGRGHYYHVGCSLDYFQSSVVRRPLGLAPSSEACCWPTVLRDTREEHENLLHERWRLLKIQYTFMMADKYSEHRA